jgi:short-subunit dehydrogenase
MLVTGASSGIGRAFAIQAGAAGGRLALLARREEELGRVADEIHRKGGTARVYPVDLADLAAVTELAPRIAADGRIDLLVHDAALSIRRSIVDTKLEDLERLVAVDYLGAAALTLSLLPPMRAQGFGHIVNVSTIGVLTGAPNFAGYVAAKAAADHFARTLRLELGGEGIRVTQIAMPLVRTPMMAPSRIYRAFPALTVESAAERIGWAIVRRPLRVAPTWTVALELLHALHPAPLQWIFTHLHEPFHALMRRRLSRLERRGV